MLQGERAATASPVDFEARLRRLLEVTSELAVALDEYRVAEVLIQGAVHALEALSGGIWMVDEGRRSLRLIHQHRVSSKYLARVPAVPLTLGEGPVGDAVLRGQSIWIESAEDYRRRFPISAARWIPFVNEPEFGSAVVPLRVEGPIAGAVSLMFKGPNRFGPTERLLLETLVLHGAQAFERARLVARERESAARADFLSRASAELASSLDLEETLACVARLPVPEHADIALVDLFNDDGSFDRVAVAAADRELAAQASTWKRRYPPGRPGMSESNRTATSILADVDESKLRAVARDPEHLQQMMDTRIGGAVTVPLRARGVTLGSISLITHGSYRPAEVPLAEELARRAALAIDAARTYREAEHAIQVRDDFLSVAGHELKTPLTTMRLQLDALMTGAVQDPSARIQRISRQVDRLTRLTHDLLDVSRSVAGRFHLQLEEVDLAEVVLEVAGRFRDEAERRGVELRVFAPARLSALADRERYDSIVSNLVSNALKYGEGKPVEVELRRNGDLGRLMVRDHGIGIAAAEHARIFQRFERAVSARHYGGLGLGLWIVRQMSEGMGGSIYLDSKPGAGSTFVVDLPVSRPGAVPGRGSEAASA